MFEMVKNSIGLFLRGKLFAEPSKAYTQLALGVILTAALFIASLRFGGLPHWAAAAIAGFIGGSIQPFLFRNLRYR